MELVSICVSIIGCVTGIISLSIVLANNMFQIGKQKVQQLDNRKTYYFDSNETETNGCCGLNYCCVVSLKITNCSSYPTTIDEIYLKSNKNIANHSNEFSFEYIEIQTNENTVTFIDIEQKAILPLKFEPFETKYITAMFPFFGPFVDEYGEEIKTKLFVITPRKEYSTEVTIPEYHQLVLNP